MIELRSCVIFVSTFNIARRPLDVHFLDSHFPSVQTLLPAVRMSHEEVRKVDRHWSGRETYHALGFDRL